MARKKFLRGGTLFYSKLGKRRRKLQKYRKAKGRHNKIRESMKGNPVKVKIGFKKHSEKKALKIISNINNLSSVKKGEQVILAKIGLKNKIEIAKKAKELGIVVLNLNIKKFLKKIENKSKKAKMEKQEVKKTETKESEAKK